MSNCGFGPAVALIEDPLAGLIACDHQGRRPITEQTISLLIDSQLVLVSADRSALRRALRLGARPGRAFVLHEQARLLKQAGCALPSWSKLAQPEQLLVAATEMGAALRDAGLQRVGHLESSFMPICETLQLTGLPLDLAAWDELLFLAAGRASRSGDELASIIGRDFTGHPLIEPSERNKMLDWFSAAGFEGLKDLSKSTLAGMDHPAARALIVWREASKLTSTYESYTERQVGGRIFGRFEPLGAATGRMSCGHPNLQNIPAALRPCVMAPPGRVLISADYSGCELRIVAALSGDTVFRETLLSGDFHSAVASRLFGQVVSKDENAHLRHAAKAINFGLLYGMGARRLASSLEMSVNEARELLKRYFEGFPRLAAWREEAQELARKTLMLRSLSGRALRLEEGKVSSTLALNYPVQGGGADLIKWAAVCFSRKIEALPGRPLLVNMVHDELLVEVDEQDAEAVQEALSEAMIRAGADLFPSVPMAVDARFSARWEH
ncbi:MAG: DNA polymerase [Myxococcota bacterium]|nr:DNA polymerase [Myxococcota bacterium]